MTSQPDLLPTMRDSGLPSTVVGRDLDIAAVYREATDQVRRIGPNPRQGAGAPSGKAERISERLAGDPRITALPGYRIVRELEDETISIFQAIFRARWTRNPLVKPSALSLHGEIAEAMVDDLLTLGRSWRPDLIVYDPLTHAGPIAAKLLGIPAVRNLFGPDVMYFHTANGLTPLLDRLGLADGDVDVLGAATVDPTPPGLQFPDDVVPANRIRTRYVPYPGLAEVPADLASWPARSRICLTWGTSIHRLLGEQAFLPREVLHGAAKLADEHSAELVLAITASQRGMLPDIPDGVRVVESVPLEALLATCTALIH